MKNEAPDNSDLRKLGELIQGIEVAMLTTRTSDGSLVSRPLQTLKLDSNGELIFFTAAKSHKVEDLTDDSVANLAYAHPGEHRYVSVRVVPAWTATTTPFMNYGHPHRRFSFLKAATTPT